MSDPMSEHGCHNCLFYDSCFKRVKQTSGWCGSWESDTSFAVKIRDALPKEKNFSLDKLIDDHWKYVEMALMTHLVDPTHLVIPKEIQVAEFHYRTAFQHGWKHALEHYGIEEKNDE